VIPASGPGRVPDDGDLDIVAVLADARAGRPDALAHLVQRYTPVLWSVARHQGLDRASSEDVVQTAWLRLVRSPESIHTPQALLGWLITLTRREAWRVARAGRLEVAADDLSAVADPAAAPGPEDDLVAREEQAALWAAVSQLEPRCQELLRLVAFVRRPDYQAVARALGMAVGSIGPTRGRCLAKLRALLATSAEWSES
jgi:RNA polymerase sigma factor (sigma-70 family)